MSIKLIHPFKDKCPDIDEFFQDNNETGIINSINSLCYKIKKLAEKYAAQYDENKFKGDALEIFAEYLIKANETDNRIGIYNYVPELESDYGVDGFGIGENGNPATVQVKFRRGDYVLTANNDHLSNFTTQSLIKYGVKSEDNKNMLIVTTGLKVDDAIVNEMFGNKVRVLNRDALRQMLDNRPEWWLKFYETVKENRTKDAGKPEVIPLRDYQTEACDALDNEWNQKGKVILPTGTGKTWIAAECIRRNILKKQEKHEKVLVKVNSSRILLCFQLFEEVYKYLLMHGIQARYVNFNSGNSNDNDYAIEMRKRGGIYRKIVSTTSYHEAKKEIDVAFKENMPVIVFSTYHSSEKFAEVGYVPCLTIHDEAHNLVSREFHKAAVLPSDANFFFTATMKYTDSEEDIGMNNINIFDNVIYSKSAKEMIEKGEMVPPKIHWVRANAVNTYDTDKADTDYDAIFKSIISAFNAHEIEIKKNSYNADEIGAKILVVCRGQQDLIEMHKTKSWENFRIEHPEVHMFALSSEFGLLQDDDFSPAPVTNSKKFKMLKKIKEMKNNEKCLIFHVDMVGEGIDVPGITGVMPFRNCEMSKFVQNVGRAARLHIEDRKRFYRGEIQVGDDKWIKPNSWIIIPTFLTNSDGYSKRFEQIVYRLREDYGFIPKQDVLIDNDNGLSEEEVIDVVNEMSKKKKHTKSGIENFTHEIDNMTAIQRAFENEEVVKTSDQYKDEINDLMNENNS